MFHAEHWVFQRWSQICNYFKISREKFYLIINKFYNYLANDSSNLKQDSNLLLFILSQSSSNIGISSFKLLKMNLQVVQNQNENKIEQIKQIFRLNSSSISFKDFLLYYLFYLDKSNIPSDHQYALLLPLVI